MFLEKTKLKNESSNDADWVHNLRIILIAAQKNYVLEAPLGARPAAGATLDVMNVWQTKADDYSIVQCAMLYGLESELQRRFERHGAYEMFDNPQVQGIIVSISKGGSDKHGVSNPQGSKGKVNILSSPICH